MSPRPRLSVVPAVLIGCLLASPARAGDFLPQTDCTMLSVPGETTYQFSIWKHEQPSLCTTELRPVAYYNLPAAPILSFDMPAGYSAEWIPNEPGAIVIRGCVGGFGISEAMHLTLGTAAAGLRARFYDENGHVFREESHLFWCGTPPVPALTSSWGQIKSLYR